MTDKLSYDIISLVALIDHVNRAANRYFWNETRIANTTVQNVEPSNNLVTKDILALQVNDTKDEDRVIYIDSIDSLYTNITG